MAAALVESDIDHFIKNQKVKLQQEKEYLGPARSSPRKQWDRSGRDNRLAEQKNQPGQKIKKQVSFRSEGPKFGEYEEERKLTDPDRKKAYKESLEKQRQDDLLRKAEIRVRDVSTERAGSPGPSATRQFYDYEGVKKQFEDEKKKSYNEQLPSPRQPPAREDLGASDTHYYQPVDKSLDQDKRKLQADVRRKYDETLAQKQQQLQNQYRQELAEDAKLAAEPGFVSNQYSIEQEKKRLQEERRKEYQEFIAQKRSEEASKYGRQNKAPDSSDLFAKMGQHDQELQRLNEERKKDYNQYQSEKSPRPERGPTDAEPPKYNYQPRGAVAEEEQPQASIPGIRPHNSAENLKKKQRNEEYNQFLREKGDREKHKFDGKKPPIVRSSGRHGRPEERQEPDADRERSRSRGARPSKEGIYASLPGINYSESADKRKMAERNKEYNEIKTLVDDKYQKKRSQSRQDELPPTGPRRGWQTPTYEDVLDKKRKEEAQYRRDDPDYDRGGMRSYASEGAINNLGEEERRLNLLDKEYDAKKVRFRDDRARQSILDDDEWLDPNRQKKEAEYTDLPQAERGSKGPVVQDYPEDVEAAPVENGGNMAAVARGNYGSLQVGTDKIGDHGPNERGSAKRRHQEEYRKELQLQIREKEASRKREKREDLRVNATGLLDPEKASWRLKGLGDPTVSPRKEYKAAPVKAFHTRFGDEGGQRGGLAQTDGNRNVQAYRPVSVRDEDGDDGRGRQQVRTSLSDRPRRRDRGKGILDAGFEGLLESRRSGGGYSGPPPGLQYQPSTYVTAGAGAGLPGGGGVGGLGSIDDAYNYYAMKNPLDPDSGGAVPSLNLSQLGGGGGGGGGGYVGGLDSTPRVRFDDGFNPGSSRHRDRSKERISPYQFASEDEQQSRSRTDKQSYQQELERQVQSDRYRKVQAREDNERYNRKLEEDIRNYNPFGRGGGGAPNKDTYGNAVTDLRQMHADNVRDPGSSSYRSPPPPADRYSPTYRPPSGPKDDLIRAPPVQTTSGGETTFARGGHGIFGNPRTDAEKSAADRYKDELRYQIADKRRREQEDKEKQRMEDELENRRLEEQRLRMGREFEEEQRKIRDKEEEARRKNDELRRQAEDRKKEQERQKNEAEERRAREQREAEERDRDRQEPVREEPQRAGAFSPPVPAARVKSSPTEKGEDSDARTASPPVHSRREPLTPQPRIERANSTDVLNQLTIMRSQLQSERRRVENALANQKNEPEVFDPRLVQRPRKQERPVQPLLPPTDDSLNPRTLQDFNHLKYRTDTESRRAFRSMFPDAPLTGMTLESQQEAMLRHQEQQLRSIREGNPPVVTQMPPRGRPRQYKKDVDGVNHFPEDFEDMPGRRNESARARRRERIPLSPRPGSQPNNPMGSVSSLDIDHIQRKNEDRLRRLQNMSGEDTVSVGDPDDILERFMAKQRFNRPASGQTLQDDSWLRPGSKAL